MVTVIALTLLILGNILNPFICTTFSACTVRAAAHFMNFKKILQAFCLGFMMPAILVGAINAAIVTFGDGFTFHVASLDSSLLNREGSANFNSCCTRA